jgi:uroporphyrinogen decarboxylase
MLSPVDYQEFSWKYINQIVEALADDSGNCFRKRMLVRSWRNGKNRASALEVDWTCSPRNARYLLVETSLYKILIHQDCYRQFR